jgi:hypothetical protein
MSKNTPGYQKEYYQKNREKILKRAKEKRQRNKKERKEYMKKKKRKIISGDYEKEWAKRHAEGIKKTPAIPCFKCDRRTRGKYKCQFCGYEFMEHERIERTDIQRLVYEEKFGKL